MRTKWFNISRFFCSGASPNDQKRLFLDAQIQPASDLKSQRFEIAAIFNRFTGDSAAFLRSTLRCQIARFYYNLRLQRLASKRLFVHNSVRNLARHSFWLSVRNFSWGSFSINSRGNLSIRRGGKGGFRGTKIVNGSLRILAKNPSFHRLVLSVLARLKPRRRTLTDPWPYVVRTHSTHAFSDILSTKVGGADQRSAQKTKVPFFGRVCSFLQFVGSRAKRKSPRHAPVFIKVWLKLFLTFMRSW